MTNSEKSSRIIELEEQIADLKGRMPKHSVRPAMVIQLEELEDQLEKAMQEAVYAYKRQVNMPYEAAVQKLKEELKTEGFGVITEIDVKDTIKKKLNLDFDKYVILGACNPPFAHQALQVERDIGLLMPCNVVVYEEGGKTFIASPLPTIIMNVVKNDKLAGVAQPVENKLKAAIDRV